MSTLPCRLTDDQPADVSHERRLRIANEVHATLLRNLPGVDPAAAEACARNIASGWGDYGVIETQATGAMMAAELAVMLSDAEDAEKGARTRALALRTALAALVEGRHG